MSQIMKTLSIPLDEEGYLRRECPLCLQEFKINILPDELRALEQSGTESFLIEAEEQGSSHGMKEDEIVVYVCPYCGQRSSKDSWWTQEQIAYATVVARNILAEKVNEQLLRSMRQLSRGSRSGLISLQVKVTTSDMKLEEEWISPESNDMKEFDLPCCQRKVKVDDNWHGTVHCFFCGFSYERG